MAALMLAAAAFAAGGLIGARFAGTDLHSAAAPASRSAGAQSSPPAPAPAAGAPMVYPAEVLRIIDGDTFEARVRIWPGLEVTTKVRLLDIDAPELKAKCSDEQTLAATARETLARMLAPGEVGLHAVRLDKYGGRVLASVTARGTPDVSAALLNAGVARPYQGGRRESWCD